VVLRLLDDGSEASASLRLYERLIESEQADLLLGPLGSAATMAAAATVERAGRLLLNVTGVTESVQREGRRQVFHVPAPLAAYGTGPLAIVESAGHKTLHVLARNDPRSREAAERLAEAAGRRGLQAVVQFTAPGATEYAAQIAAARARNAEAWIAFGIAEDAAEMVKTFKRISYAPWLFLAQGAAEPEFIRRVGQDAEHALGLSAYEPNVRWAATDALLAAWRERWPGEPGNCGVLVHASTPLRLYGMFPQSIECQMHAGNAGDYWCIGEDNTVPDMESRRVPRDNWGVDGDRARRIENVTDESEKSPGEWNLMVIECRGDAISVWV